MSGESAALEAGASPGGTLKVFFNDEPDAEASEWGASLVDEERI